MSLRPVRSIAAAAVVGAALLLSIASGTTERTVRYGPGNDPAPPPEASTRGQIVVEPKIPTTEQLQQIPEPRVSYDGPTVSTDPLPECDSDKDCPGTENWCKDRGDGIKLCRAASPPP